MTQRPIVYFSLQTQFENLGDCLINELLIRELARHADIKIVHRRAPQWLLARLQLLPEIEVYRSKAGWFKDLFKRMALRRPIVFAFKPGHYITSNRAKSITYSASLVAFCGLCRLQGGRVIRSGVSLDRFGRLQTFLQSLLGRLHTSYGVRDQASLDYARRLGVSAAHYTPDLAFLLMGAKTSTGLETKKPLTSEHPRPRLSMSFRRQGTLKDSARVRSLIATLQNCATDCQLQPMLVEQVTFDGPLADELAHGLECAVVRFQQSEESVLEIFDNYAQSRVVISNRLHSLLFGWTAGALPIPLVDNAPHSKIIELFKHLGLSELIQLTEDLQDLPAHLHQILGDEARWRKKLERIFKDQQAILQEALAGCLASTKSRSEQAVVHS